jgi:hypothetical protein
MSEELNFRYKLLEQKVEIMQKEVSDVLHEMQTTIMAITQTYSTALKVLVERADKLDEEMRKLNLPKEAPKNETGIEL